MALPLKVRNAFRMGEARAAYVPASRPGGQAWVWVEPILRSGKSYGEVHYVWTLRHEASERYDDTIVKYRVRYLELSSWNPELDLNYDTRSMERERAVRDESAEVADEAALEEWLTRYLTDLTQLRAPGVVDYWF